jgi:hypothetical protein
VVRLPAAHSNTIQTKTGRTPNQLAFEGGFLEFHAGRTLSYSSGE